MMEMDKRTERKMMEMDKRTERKTMEVDNDKRGAKEMKIQTKGRMPSKQAMWIWQNKLFEKFVCIFEKLYGATDVSFNVQLEWVTLQQKEEKLQPVLHTLGSAEMIENINVTCGQIETAVGFVYMVSSVILNQTQNPDCDQSWYSQDGVVIAVPSYNRWEDPVTNVRSDRIITDHCVQKLLHEIDCPASGLTHRTTYRVWNETTEALNTELNETTVTPTDQLFWIFGVLPVLVYCLSVSCCVKRSSKILKLRDVIPPVQGSVVTKRTELMTYGADDRV
ncbi:uncharacterized protein LOC127648220 [Xyrauchen texanus]|uniref:uncharacterized protein LOC127648220 n=1 Tax=Xyrauchen texanus TaxID=154827 RepID=UPI0022422A04|nr:uncharacterized protein LOC127648220 [Xyrauchen texanus]